MDQDRIDAVVADLLSTGCGRLLKDLYRDLRDGADGWEASFVMMVACRKAWLRDFGPALPGAHRWWRIFNRLNDVALPVISDL